MPLSPLVLFLSALSSSRKEKSEFSWAKIDGSLPASVAVDDPVIRRRIESCRLHLLRRSGCCMMFIRGTSRKRRTGAVPVYLNVYDLTPINGYAYWFGLGVYHSGVQVNGVEYAYGAHEHPTTGIFEGEPRQCPGFAFRKSILIGRTDLGPREVRALVEEMAVEYTGDTYNLISKNCNHFCDEVCLRLTGKPIPKWINRLARIGFLCNCVLPAQVAAVRQRGADEVKGGGGSVDGERRRLRSNSARFPPVPTAAAASSSSDDPPTRISQPVVTISSRSAGSRRSRRSSSLSSAGGVPSTLTV